jgi:hypothetical protein
MRLGIVLVLTAALLAGCGSNARDDVQAKVEQFAKATASRDSKTMCEQVIAPILIESYLQRGITCRQYWNLGLSHVSKPTLAIGRIVITGSRASVIALTGASGEVSSLDAIKLVKTSVGWRIVSLGSPVLPPSSKPAIKPKH